MLCASFSSALGAQNATLAWDPNAEPDLAGYRLKYGTSSGNYDQAVEVIGATTATVTNLAPGTTYFFVVTAYNTTLLESLPSNEVSLTTATGNQAPTVSLTIPGNGGTWTAPANLTLNASASDGDGSISRVEFYNGTTKLGEDSSSPYTLAWSGVAQGTYSIVARAFDNLGAWADTAPVSVTVTTPTTPPPVWIGGVPGTVTGQGQTPPGPPNTGNVNYVLGSEEALLADYLVHDAGQQRASMQLDPILSRIARERAADMAARNYFDHTNPDGFAANALVRAARYRLPAWWNTDPATNYLESIAAGSSSAANIWTTWIGSAAHREHLLAEDSFFADQTSYGVGYAYSATSTHQHYLVIITAPPNAAAGNDALFLTQNVPAQMVAGSAYSVSIQMLNTGANTWSPAGGYKLGAQDQANNQTWGLAEVNVPGSVSPGGTATFNFVVTAPAGTTPAVFQWQMLQGQSSAFGEPTPALPIPVNNPPPTSNYVPPPPAAYYSAPTSSKKKSSKKKSKKKKSKKKKKK